MANHCTADFPNPVGMTIMVEPDKAVRNASSWYALASTPPLRRGWATSTMIEGQQRETVLGGPRLPTEPLI